MTVTDDEYDVYVSYIDYGNVEVVPSRNLRPLMPKFAKLPRQAFASALSRVSTNYCLIYTVFPPQVFLAMPFTRCMDPRSKAVHTSFPARKTRRGKLAEESHLHDRVYLGVENSA